MRRRVLAIREEKKLRGGATSTSAFYHIALKWTFQAERASLKIRYKDSVKKRVTLVH